MSIHKRFILKWLVFLIVIIPTAANGETAGEKGLKIATAMERRDDGWIGQTADVEFNIKNEKKQGMIYEFRSRWFEALRTPSMVRCCKPTRPAGRGRIPCRVLQPIPIPNHLREDASRRTHGSDLPRRVV